MNKTAKISVIIPVYNPAETFHRCLDSVFGQTCPPSQVIIVDDGSSRDVSLLLDGYPDVFFISQSNQGPSAARNAGVAIAESEYIAFLDADDYWLPEFLAECSNFLNSNPGAVAVSTAATAIGWDGGKSSIPKSLATIAEELSGQPVILENFYEFWAQHDHVRTGSVVIRREIIQKAGGMQTAFRIAEDLEYWGLIASFGSWGFIPQPLFVTDGTSAAASEGWLKKLRKRGQNCPSVDIWQGRILPRLCDKDLNFFKIVRGRIALNFAYIKLLAGLTVEARKIVQTFGQDFPNNQMSLLLNRCATSPFLWRLCCVLLLWREVFKSFYLRFRFAKVCL